MRLNYALKGIYLMLYLHFCSTCKRLHILSGHRITCPACDNSITELSIPYEIYIKMDSTGRESLLNQCTTPHMLQNISASYAHRYQRKKRN